MNKLFTFAVYGKYRESGATSIIYGCDYLLTAATAQYTQVFKGLLENLHKEGQLNEYKKSLSKDSFQIAETVTFDSAVYAVFTKVVLLSESGDNNSRRYWHQEFLLFPLEQISIEHYEHVYSFFSSPLLFNTSHRLIEEVQPCKSKNLSTTEISVANCIALIDEFLPTGKGLIPIINNVDFSIQCLNLLALIPNFYYPHLKIETVVSNGRVTLSLTHNQGQKMFVNEDLVHEFCSSFNSKMMISEFLLEKKNIKQTDNIVDFKKHLAFKVLLKFIEEQDTGNVPDYEIATLMSDDQSLIIKAIANKYPCHNATLLLCRNFNFIWQNIQEDDVLCSIPFYKFITYLIILNIDIISKQRNNKIFSNELISNIAKTAITASSFDDAGRKLSKDQFDTLCLMESTDSEWFKIFQSEIIPHLCVLRKEWSYEIIMNYNIEKEFIQNLPTIDEETTWNILKEADKKNGNKSLINSTLLSLIAKSLGGLQKDANSILDTFSISVNSDKKIDAVDSATANFVLVNAVLQKKTGISEAISEEIKKQLGPVLLHLIFDESITKNTDYNHVPVWIYRYAAKELSLDVVLKKALALIKVFPKNYKLLESLFCIIEATCNANYSPNYSTPLPWIVHSLFAKERAPKSTTNIFPSKEELLFLKKISECPNAVPENMLSLENSMSLYSYLYCCGMLPDYSEVYSRIVKSDCENNKSRKSKWKTEIKKAKNFKESADWKSFIRTI